MGRPKYFDYAVRGNLIVLMLYLDHEGMMDMIENEEKYQLKRTGRRKGA